MEIHKRKVCANCHEAYFGDFLLCPICGASTEHDEYTNKKKVCANCHKSYIEGDKYCRYCGAPMGSPVFIEERIACIYGPRPVERVHTCEKCGYSWKTNLMVDREQFCPKCGGSADTVKKDDSEDFIKTPRCPPLD